MTFVESPIAAPDDLISRSAAINIIKKYLRINKDLFDAIEYELGNLPPAQPEIIRCKDCKHWREGTAFSYCDKLHGMGVLDALDYMTAEDDYCSMAERRTDETD